MLIGLTLAEVDGRFFAGAAKFVSERSPQGAGRSAGRRLRG